MDIADIIPHVEALIFASDHPLPAIEILDLLNQSQGFLEDKVNINQLTTALDAVREKYASAFYSFEVVESGGGFQFLTKPAYHATVARLNGDKYLKRLSKASLETLAIIAYKQPVTKSDIESIRGVNADYSVQKLLEKELIAIKGRRDDAPGKPLLYVTSESFMDYFGLNSPDDLPRIKEVQQEGSLPTLPLVNRPLRSLEALKDAEIVAIKVVDTPSDTHLSPESNGWGVAHPVAFEEEEGEAEARPAPQNTEAHPEDGPKDEMAAATDKAEERPEADDEGAVLPDGSESETTSVVSADENQEEDDIVEETGDGDGPEAEYAEDEEDMDEDAHEDEDGDDGDDGEGEEGEEDVDDKEDRDDDEDDDEDDEHDSPPAEATDSERPS